MQYERPKYQDKKEKQKLLYFFNDFQSVLKINLPPVTSHIASIGEESLGTKPLSLSTAGVPDNLKTKENSR